MSSSPAKPPESERKLLPAYATATDLNVYLRFHYGRASDGYAAEFGLERFQDFNPRVIERFVIEPKSDGRTTRALELGCSVGRACFELSRLFEEVIGIDQSATFIDAAERIRRGERVPLNSDAAEQASSEWMVSLPIGCRPERVRFQVGDACQVPEFPAPFDCVVALNLLCRVPTPGKLLHQLGSLVRVGGQLIVSTPWSWNEAFTPRAEWLDGTPATTLHTELAPTFEMKDTAELPFLMQESERKYHWCVAHCTSWVRRSTPQP